MTDLEEENGNPLQYSCLENPRDRGAWWAAIYGVTQSQTRLKQLSSSSSSMTNLQVTSYSMVKDESISSKIRNKTRKSTLINLFNVFLEVLAIANRKEK